MRVALRQPESVFAGAYRGRAGLADVLTAACLPLTVAFAELLPPPS